MYFYRLFGSTYGSGGYDSATFNGAASSSMGGSGSTNNGGSTPRDDGTTTVADGGSGSSAGGSVLTNTGFDIALSVTLASIIIFVALLVRFWRKPAK